MVSNNIKYKLIALDMDGTLLNDDKEVSENNLKAINYAISKGVKVAICSGRIPSTLKYYADIIAKGEPMICCDGGCIVDGKGKTIWERLMTSEECEEIINIARSIKISDENSSDSDEGMYYHLYDGSIIVSERFEYNTKKFYNFFHKLPKEYRVEIRLITDGIKYVNKPERKVRKFVIMDREISRIDVAREKIEQTNRYEIVKSEFDNINISPKGVCKGSGLMKLAEYYGFSIDECIAIGNDENDKTMIEAAGIGAVVNNSNEKLKEISNYVSPEDNNNDGVAEIIYKFV